MSKQDIEKRLGFAAQGVKETTRTSAKAKFVRFMDLETWKNSKGTVFTAGIEEDSGNRFTPYVTSRDSSGGLQLRTLSAPTFKTEKGARKWLNTWMQSNKSTSSRSGVKAKFVRIVTTPQGRYTTNLDKNTRAPIEGGKGYVMVDPAQYITPKRVRVQGTKGEIEVRAIVEGKEIVGVSAKLVSARPGVKAKFATEVGRKGNKSAMISRDATGTWYAYVVQRIETGIGKDEDMLGTMRAYSTEDRAKRAAIKALDTSGFSRPGVKAKFDREVGRKGNKSAMIAKLKGAGYGGLSWLAYVVQHDKEEGDSVLGTMRPYSTEAEAKSAALRGLETSGLRGGFARPTTKAKA